MFIGTTHNERPHLAAVNVSRETAAFRFHVKPQERPRLIGLDSGEAVIAETGNQHRRHYNEDPAHKSTAMTQGQTRAE